MTWREGFEKHWDDTQNDDPMDTTKDYECSAFLAGAKWAVAEIRKDIENRAGCDCFDDVQSLQVDLEEL